MKLKRERLYGRKKRIIQQAMKQREEAGGDDIITQGTMGLQMQNLVDALEHGVMGSSSAAASSTASSSAVPKAEPKAKAKAEPSGEQQTADEELELFDAGGFAFGGAGRFEDVTGDTEVATTTAQEAESQSQSWSRQQAKASKPLTSVDASGKEKRRPGKR